MSIGDILVKLGQQKALSQNELSELHQWGELTQNNNQIIPGWLKPGSTDPFPDRIKAREAIFDVIKIYNGAVQTGEIDGDLFLGEDISDPAKATFHAFSTSQTYNTESMGAGDILFGDNSSGKPNFFYDASVPAWNFRLGTVINSAMKESRSFGNYGVRVYRATDQSIGAGGALLSFSDENYDDAGFWVVGTPTRFTIPANMGGTYLIGASINFDYDASGDYRVLALREGGDTIVAAQSGSVNTASAGLGITVTSVVELAGETYVEAIAVHDKAGSIDVKSFGGTPNFWISRIR